MPVSYILENKKSLRHLLGVFFFIMVKVTRLLKNSPESTGTAIAIITLHKLGDSVFTIPAIKEILKYWGKNYYLFCFEETQPIYRLFFGEESIITLQHSDFYLNGRIAKNIVRKKIKEIRLGRIYDLTGSVTSASILFTSKVEYIIGINEDYFKSIYTDYIPKRTDPHIMDIYLDIINPFISEHREKLKEFPVTVDKNSYLLIHPFAGWQAKEWNFYKFVKLAEHLSFNYDVIIVSPPRRISEDIIREIKSLGIPVLETETTSELIEVIKNCSIIISNDSGPIYIASILGKPTFTIYGPTNPKFHLPYGPNHQYVQKVLKCSPEDEKKYCFTDAGRNGCPAFLCMNSISLDDVEKKLIPFIEKLGIRRKESSE